MFTPLFQTLDFFRVGLQGRAHFSGHLGGEGPCFFELPEHIARGLPILYFVRQWRSLSRLFFVTNICFPSNTASTFLCKSNSLIRPSSFPFFPFTAKSKTRDNNPPFIIPCIPPNIPRSSLSPPSDASTTPNVRLTMHRHFLIRQKAIDYRLFTKFSNFYHQHISTPGRFLLYTSEKTTEKSKLYRLYCLFFSDRHLPIMPVRKSKSCPSENPKRNESDTYHDT